MSEQDRIPEDEHVYNLLVGGWMALSYDTKMAIADLATAELDIDYRWMIETLVEYIYRNCLIYPEDKKRPERLNAPWLIAQLRLLREHVLKVSGMTTTINDFLDFHAIPGLEGFSFLMQCRAILENLPGDAFIMEHISEVTRGEGEYLLDLETYMKLHRNRIWWVGEIVALAQRDLQYHGKALLTITKMSPEQAQKLLGIFKLRGWLDESLCRQYCQHYAEGSES